MLAGAAAPAALAQADAARPLNLIHIGVDTWGAHHLGVYGHPEYRTPHVDALFAKSAMFMDAYPQALPTLPARRVLYTGRQVFPSLKFVQPDDQVRIRGWHPLYAEDVTLAETLAGTGYVTSIVSDLYHQFKPGKNFNRGFDCWNWIRGQEADRFRSAPRARIDLGRYSHASQPIPRGPKPTGVYQYLVNRQDWKTEEDWLAAQVFNTASHWLRANAAESQPFYLHIESFSPHEFWDPPEAWYRRYFTRDYNGPTLIHPPLSTARMTPLEVEHAQAMYKGFVSFVDDRIGRFLSTVESLGLMSNTIIVFVADHGTMMGEQGQLHKGETRLRTQCTQVPLAIYHPRRPWAGRRIGGFVQHTDLFPTVLDLVGVKAPARVTGESLVPLVEESRASKRDWIVTGWGEHVSFRTPEWNYIQRWSEGTPGFEELYTLKSDPLELKPLRTGHESMRADFRQRLGRFIEESWSVTKGGFALPA